MYIPLVFNIVVYSLIIARLRRLARMRSANNTMVTIRAMIMCGMFMCTWIPGQVVQWVASGDPARYQTHIQATHFILFLNCLTDPLIYTCSPKTIVSCVRRVRDYSSQIEGGAHTLRPPVSGFSKSISDVHAMVAVNSSAMMDDLNKVSLSYNTMSVSNS